MPIGFLHTVAHVPSEKNGKSLTVKIKISPTIKKTYKVLVEGGYEAFISRSTRQSWLIVT